MVHQHNIGYPADRFFY